MADITMCIREDCTIKKDCYRFIAKKSKYQSYSDFLGYDNDYNNCMFFVSIPDKD